MRTIGIDIGTTSISGVVLDREQGEVVASRTIPNDSFIHTQNEGERIQDAEQIAAKAKQLLDDLLEEYPEVEVIGLTGQMHGIVYVDRAGKCVSPLYTWQDQRGEMAAQEIREKTGYRAAAGYGLTTHIALCRQAEEAQQGVKICTIPDYLGMVLTGRQTPLVHSSMAASMGLFSVTEGKFDLDAMQKVSINSDILPQVTNDAECIGIYKNRYVCAAIGDNQASFLGTVGMKENTALVNVGTGSQISVLSRHYAEAEGIEARPFLGGMYLLAGSSLCGGRAYAILEHFFRRYEEAAGHEPHAQYSVMERLAEMPLGKDEMQVTTTFYGTRSDPDLRGRISNLSEDNFTPEGLVQGVLTGMAAELHEMYEVMHRENGIQVIRLVGSGNGIRKNRALQNIVERMFHVKLMLSPYEEEAACGAAYCAEEWYRKLAAQIKRIIHMEAVYDKIRSVADRAQDKDTLAALDSEIRELTQYYESSAWMADVDADRRGEIPKDLKRGILTEDAIDDLLCDIDRIVK